MGGSFALAQKSVTEAYTANTEDAVIMADASGLGTNLVLSLPTAVGIKGRTYTIKQTDSSVRQNLPSPIGAETIDGEGTLHLTTQW